MTNCSDPLVAIAGVSGFIGRALFLELAKDYRVVGLSRSPPRQVVERPNAQLLQANLFYLDQVQAALQGVHTAFYLVHSMLPQAALSQGHFADLDLLCADNFARAAKACGVQHIIYLSGLLPADRKMGSSHLASRAEVQQALGGYGIPTTTLRAGLIMGGEGSSFQMMLRLVARLPIMLTPSWTRVQTQPVALSDTLALLQYVLRHPGTDNRSFDIGCPEIVTYSDMMLAVARCLGRKAWMIPVPNVVSRWSILWVALITQTPTELVAPLIESLQCSLVVQDGHALAKAANFTPTPFATALQTAIDDYRQGQSSQKYFKNRSFTVQPCTVMAVHRLPSVEPTSPDHLAMLYAQFLQKFFWPWINVRYTRAQGYSLSLWGLGWKLLQLQPLATYPQRSVFAIASGWLVPKTAQPQGRFEFRWVLQGAFFLAIVQDYRPRLPWRLYRCSQAVVHALSMHFFKKFLKRQRS